MARYAWIAPARTRWPGSSGSRIATRSPLPTIPTAVGRADEPQSLFIGGDPLPAGASAALAGTGGDRQDRGQQQHDRPRRAQNGPSPVRGARRLQMVCAGFFRRLVLLWRRGKRGGKFFAARRQRLDDR